MSGFNTHIFFQVKAESLFDMVSFIVTPAVSSPGNEQDVLSKLDRILIPSDSWKV
jgi:hypothetical protein